MDDDNDFSAAFKEATGSNHSSGQDLQAASETNPSEQLDDGQQRAAEQPKPQEAAAPNDQHQAAQPSVDELHRQLQESIHRERSASGRISAFAQENERLKASMAELSAKLDAIAAAQAAAAPREQPKPDVLDEAPDLRDAVSKRLGQHVDPLKQAVDELSKRVDKVAEQSTQAVQAVQPVISAEQQRQFEQTWRALDEMLGQGWRADIKSPEFHAWVQSDPDIKDQYAKAVTPAQSARVLRNFYAEMGRQPTRPQPSTQQTQSAADANQQRLRASAGIPSRGSGRPSGIATDDFTGAFKAGFQRSAAQVN